MEYPNMGMHESGRHPAKAVPMNHKTDPQHNCNVQLAALNELAEVEGLLAAEVRKKAAALACEDGRQAISEQDINRAWNGIVVKKDRDISVNGLRGCERSLREYLDANTRVTRLIERLDEIVVRRACEIATAAGGNIAGFDECRKAWNEVTFTRPGDPEKTHLLAESLCPGD